MIVWPIVQSVADRYFAVCESAQSDPEVVKTFKKNPDYIPVLEHLNYEDGLYYIELMDEVVPDDLEKFRVNDLYGGATTYDYGEWGQFSPSTLRYIKNLMDIKSLTKKSRIESVVEVGGGYGGLARTILSEYPDAYYSIIDDHRVNILTDQYLDQFMDIEGQWETIDYTFTPQFYNIDLAISNYALSELEWELQFEYYQRVFGQANYIYITYNFVVPGADKALTNLMSLIDRDFIFNIANERPGNQVIFGRKRGLEL